MPKKRNTTKSILAKLSVSILAVVLVMLIPPSTTHAAGEASLNLTHTPSLYQIGIAAADEVTLRTNEFLTWTIDTAVAVRDQVAFAILPTVRFDRSLLNQVASETKAGVDASTKVLEETVREMGTTVTTRASTVVMAATALLGTENLLASIQPTGESFLCKYLKLFCPEETPTPTTIVVDTPTIPPPTPPLTHTATTTIIREIVREVGEGDSYITNTYPTTYVTTSSTNDPLGSFVTRDLFDIQVDAIYDSFPDPEEFDITLESIESLSDVASMTETTGDLFSWNGTNWTNVATSTLGFGSSSFSTTEIDTSLELQAILTDETGTGNLVFSTSPTFTGNTTIANASTTNLSVSGTTYANLVDGCVEVVDGVFTSIGTNCGTSSGGITSLNGLTASSQTFATSTSGGLSLLITSGGGAHTFTAGPADNYSIPLTASTTEWQTAYASTTALTPSYLRGLFSNTTPGLTYSNTTGITSLTADYTIPLTASTTQWQTAYASTTALTPSYIRTLFSGTAPIAYSAGVFSITGDAIGDTELAFNTGQHLTTTSNPTFANLTLTNASTTNLTVSGTTYFPSGVWNSSGSVGVGTTSPLAKLDVNAGGSYQWTPFGSEVAAFTRAATGQSAVVTITSDNLTRLSFASTTVRDSAFIQYQVSNQQFNINNQTVAGALTFGTNVGTERMRIDASGNVGIGTSSPTSILDVRYANVADGGAAGLGTTAPFIGTSDAQAADKGGTLYFGGAQSTAFPKVAFGAISGRKENSVSGENGGYLQFSTNNSGGTFIEKMRITSSGNVGIGTTTPTQKLTVTSTSNYDGLTLSNSGAATTEALRFVDNSGNASSRNWAIVHQGVDWGDLIFRVSASAATDPYNQTAVLSLKSSGNVGIGTAAPATESTNAKLSVVGTAGQVASSLATSNTNAVASFRGNSSSGYSLAIGAVTSSSFPYVQGVNYNGGGASASLLLNPYGGNVGIGDTSPDYMLDVKGTICQDTNSDETCDGAVTSDERLKEHIENIENPLDKLAELRGVTFEWDETNPHTLHLGRGTTQVGMIAQEVERVFPSLVYEDEAGYRMIDYQKLVGPLVEGVNELHFSLADLLATGSATSTSTFAFLNDPEQDTVWSRLVKLAEGFVDGVLSVVGVKADIGEFSEKICIDGTCITGNELRALLHKEDGGSETGSEENSTPETEEESELEPESTEEEILPEENGVLLPGDETHDTEEPVTEESEPEAAVVEPTPEPEIPEDTGSAEETPEN